MSRTLARAYEETHPWITFKVDLRKVSHKTWLLFGEAESKCQHVAGAPLRPAVAAKLHTIYVSKGVHGTTSIEGNTLSESQVQRRVTGDLPLPPSLEYLGREVDNVLRACNLILHDVQMRRPMELNRARIEEFNRIVLDGIEVEDGVVPGKMREGSVGVMRYLAPPATDSEYLVDRMCTWLNTLTIDDEAMTFPVAILKAILAHLYIAWIHPFGDGNGRTARLVEFQLLVQAGIPIPAAHLLSDFYNKTRDAYYRQLDASSKPPYAIEHFIHYAVRGFVDELREQLITIREEQLRVTWENFVHESFRDQDTPAKRRQKHIVLDLTDRGEPIRKSKLPELSPRVAMGYAGRSMKTISRDVNELLAMGLIRYARNGLIANIDQIRAFLPARFEEVIDPNTPIPSTSSAPATP